MHATLGLPKQDRSRATRERLLEAAVASLAESGWARTTVATVATRAGVSRGAAQHHFPTRTDLVMAAIRHMTEVRLAELRDVLEVNSPTGGRPPPGPPLPKQNRTRWALDQLVGLYTGTLFAAALHVWTEAAVDTGLRDQVIPLERALAREAYRLAVTLLDVDGDDPSVRVIVAGTLDLARGLGLANVLTDDAKRRAPILDAWAAQLDAALSDLAESALERNEAVPKLPPPRNARVTQFGTADLRDGPSVNGGRPFNDSRSLSPSRILRRTAGSTGCHSVRPGYARAARGSRRGSGGAATSSSAGIDTAGTGSGGRPLRRRRRSKPMPSRR